MTDVTDLVSRVAARAEGDSGPLPPGTSPEDIAEAERLLGFRLPPLLAKLYQDVADGGFGPPGGFLPLTGEGPTVLSTYASERRSSARDAIPYWPEGVLPVLDWGCGMYAAVDTRTEEGAVLLYEPNAVDDDGAAAWFLDAGSLAAWLETWLAGTGWYREDADEDDLPLGGPVPWEEAAARIAEQPAGREGPA
ncbi:MULTISPECIES: SMI1/KNR4 family protein [Streptomyces]|uniref:SMI1/KNR4 family protein n=2 Tax=Streptomyces TaxID=1883 RepID=A0ABU4K066_9ACTN|nr:SMI1/KNR4 family protein [Streptomyces roseolus]MDX2291155.1 SMI1/KNR4 family protein [Streptomyces roseolus]